MPLATLGLWGDGDEVWAITDALKTIGVEVPEEDAPQWFTVGDLWTSVARKAANVALSSDAWDQFRQVLAKETGVDWTEVSSETALIDGRGHNIVSRLWTTIRERFAKQNV